MKRAVLLAAALSLAAWSASAVKPRVSRQTMMVLERKFDKRIEAFSADDPFYLLGTTRGVYLDNYGVVFTAELNLVGSAVVTPFRPAFSKEQIDRLRRKKLDRVTGVKKVMRDMMVDSATALDAVPPDQNVVVGVTLFYYAWEDTNGLPGQIVMLARRRSLADFEAGKLKAADLDAAIQVEEF
ncbi:MAG: hypothetical protein KIT09_25480 [Bryobacteraceae bacterium]|nr:hypothetical protein [Bryobacteraceae bacterium]